MNTEEKIIYIEVYNILELLGDEYINKIPISLYIMIKSNVTNIKDLKYKSLKDINKNNIQKKSLAMIALLHANYWCESQKEKEELIKIFTDNFIKNEKERRDRFNPDNIFNNNLNIEEKKITEIAVYKEPSLWKKIIGKIKNLIFGYK